MEHQYFLITRDVIVKIMENFFLIFEPFSILIIEVKPGNNHSDSDQGYFTDEIRK